MIDIFISFLTCRFCIYYYRISITFQEILKLEKTTLAGRKVVIWKIHVVWNSSCSSPQIILFSFKRIEALSTKPIPSLTFFSSFARCVTTKVYVSVLRASIHCLEWTSIRPSIWLRLERWRFLQSYHVARLQPLWCFPCLEEAIICFTVSLAKNWLREVIRYVN